VGGVVFFGVELQSPNWGAAAAFLALTVLSFSSLGILAASFILVLKRGNPVNWVFTSLSRLLGGVYFPLTVLPGWLQKVALFLPLTYALEGMRMTLLQGRGLGDLRSEFLALLLFTAVTLVLGFWSAHFAVARARRDGTLGQY
jgi:ABC-2 type transport system permease protein